MSCSPDVLALLDAYQAGTIDEPGCQQLLQLMDDDPRQAQAIADELLLRRAVGEALRDRSGIDLQRAVRAEINRSGPSTARIQKRVLHEIRRQPGRRPAGRAVLPWTALAASLLLGLLGFGWWQQSAAAAAARSVSLADGSAMQPGMRLEASEPTTLRQGDGTQLAIHDAALRLEQAGPAWRWTLDEGRLAAAVSKGSDFRVRTPNAEVRVLGTRFTLQSSPAGDLLGVTEGVVRFSASDGGANVDCHPGTLAMVARQGRVPVVHRWQPPASQLLFLDCRYGGQDPLRGIQLKQQFAPDVPEADEEVVRCGGRGLPLLNDRFLFTEHFGPEAMAAIQQAGAVSLVMRQTVTYPKRLRAGMLPIAQFFDDQRQVHSLITVQLALLPQGKEHCMLITVAADREPQIWIDGELIATTTANPWSWGFDEWHDGRLMLSWMFKEQEAAQLAYLSKCTRVLQHLEVHAGRLDWEQIPTLP